METTDDYAGIKWTARIISALMVTFFLVMFIGEGMDAYKRSGSILGGDSPPGVYILLGCWFAGLACLVWAWWNEPLGGIGSLVFLSISIILTNFVPDATFSPTLIIFLFPGALFVFHWWALKKSEKYQDSMQDPL